MKRIAAVGLALCLAGGGPQAPASAREAAMAGAPAPAQPSKARLALAHELMDASGLDEASFERRMNQMLGGTKMGERARKAFIARVPAMIDKVTLIYAQMFDEDELRAMIAFQRSPGGKAMAAKAPQLTQAETPLVFWAIGARMSEEGHFQPIPEIPGETPPAPRLALALKVVRARQMGEQVIESPFFAFDLMNKAMQMAGLAKDRPDAKEAAATAKANAESKARMQAFLPQIEDRVAGIYARVYTDEELQAQLDYFTSPAGRAQVAHQAELLAVLTAVGMQAMVDVMKETGGMPKT